MNTQKASQWAPAETWNQDLARQGDAGISQDRRYNLWTVHRRTRTQQCGQVQVGNGNAPAISPAPELKHRGPVEAYRDCVQDLCASRQKAPQNSSDKTSSLPGEGKTLTTMNLACAMRSFPATRCWLSNADLRTCGLTSMLDHPSTLGLAEVMAGDG